MGSNTGGNFVSYNIYCRGGRGGATLDITGIGEKGGTRGLGDVDSISIHVLLCG